MRFMDWLDLRDFGLDRHSAMLAEAARERQGRQGQQEATMNGLDRDGTAMEVVRAGTYQGRVANVVSSDDEEWCRRAGFAEREWRRLAFLRWLYRQGRLAV
jgi:hypothetical protein